jgi:hypothetical protein
MATISLFVGDIGVVLTFNVGSDLSSATQIELLVDGKAFPCTIPSSSSASPTYTTTGQEDFTQGNLAAQLKVTFSPSRIYHTNYFQMFVQKPNPG